MGCYLVVPSLRKLLTEKVDPSLFGALFAVPALIEGVGAPLGGLIYNAAFELNPLHSQWIFYGISVAIVILLLVFLTIGYLVQKIYF